MSVFVICVCVWPPLLQICDRVCGLGQCLSAENIQGSPSFENYLCHSRWANARTRLVLPYPIFFHSFAHHIWDWYWRFWYDLALCMPFLSSVLWNGLLVLRLLWPCLPGMPRSFHPCFWKKPCLQTLSTIPRRAVMERAVALCRNHFNHGLIELPWLYIHTHLIACDPRVSVAWFANCMLFKDVYFYCCHTNATV